MIRTKFKRTLSLLLTIVTVLSTFTTIGATNAFAATGEKTGVYIVEFPRSGDTASGNWGHGALSFLNGWKGTSSQTASLRTIDSYDGNIVYCIEPGTGQYTGDILTEKGENFFNDIGSNGQISGDEIKLFIGRIMHYGYRGKVSTSWKSQNDSDADKMAHAFATQLLIWETIVGERDEYFNHKSAGSKNEILDSISSTHPLRSKILKYYNSMGESVQNHTKVPSFCTKSSGSAKTIELEWNGSKYVATLTDSNSVLSNYEFSANVSGVSFSISGNKLTISMDKAPSDVLTISANKKNAVRRGVIVWTDGKYSPGNGIQDVASYAQEVSDPVKGFVKAKVSYGSAKIIKTSEDGKVDNISFTITGNGINQTVKTNSKGEMQIDNLSPGTYTVTEESIDKYVPQKPQTVTVVSGQTAAVSFNNTLKKFRVNVTKKDIETTTPQGDATLAGAVYGIYQGDTLIDKYTTDANGQFTTNYYVCGDNWSIKEIAPSAGYNLDSTTYPVGASAKDYSVEYNSTLTNVNEQVIKGNVSVIKHTDDGSTQIETPEKGATFQIYLKSAGSFANAKDSEKDTIVCDDDGFASSKLLPYGVYTVHQTKGWDGRELIADFDVYIQSEGKTYKYLINNANFYSYLKVVKKDAETGKAIAYEGAGFEIYDTDGQRVSMQFTYPQVTSIHTFYTNSEGYLITPEKLPYGDYTLVEVQAPYGYVLDSTPVKFSISQENASTDTGVTVVKVTAKDMPQKGVIEITKTGEIFSSVKHENDRYTPVYEEKNLKDAVFEVYAAEDIITADGTIRAEKGTLVDTITTDDKGIAKSKELYLGKYTVIEKTAPNSFVNSGKKYMVELTYADQHITVTITNISVYNQRQKVVINLSKAMEKDEIFNIGSNGEISSVQFGVFANEDISASDGTSIPKDGLITTANCDKDGKVTFDCDLPIGYKFYVKEIATDNQYIIDDTKYEFDTEYQGQEKEIINIEFKDIQNKIIRGTVKGLKLDRETNKPIENVEFGLYKTDTTKNAILTAKTDKDGIFVFDNIPYGKYVIKELKAPDGYMLSDEAYPIAITESEQVVEIKAVNDKITEIKTTATINGKKEVYASKELTIADTVEYKHLIVGQEYVIKGILMDKSTGKVFKINGKEVTSEVTFNPTSPTGNVDVKFTFDGSSITKTTNLVVFETLYKDNIELAKHTDIKDEGQTVSIKYKAPTTPKTGDDSHSKLWIALAVISALGIATSGVLGFKKKKRRTMNNGC